MSGESNEENELYGPKAGVKLTLDQADLIIQRHFPSLCATGISHINRGYNNRVYIVTATEKDNSQKEQSFIIRLSGRFWTRYKTENEVCAMLYMGKYGKIPVPEIYGFCTDKEASGVNAEYICMERVPGEPLEHVWNDQNIDNKKRLLDQVAEITAKIQSIKFDKLGSLQFLPELGDSHGLSIVPNVDIEPKESMLIGKGVEFEGGPFDSYLDYFKTTAETEIEYLRTNAIMKESDGYEIRLNRIEKFVHVFGELETVPEKIDREALVDVPFVFTHGDLEPRNILVDRDTLKISGIIDWEFSGAYPIDEEWFTGFGFVSADTSDGCVFNDGLPPGRNILDKSEPEELNSLREYFLQVLKKNGVATPDVIRHHMIRAELYYFKGYICPWWLREERDPIPECHFKDRKKACERVDAILDKYGF